MTALIDYLTGHPLILGIAVVISLMIVLSFARKIIHFLMVLAALGILYVAWVSWHGGDPKDKAHKAGQKAQQALHQSGGVIKAIDGFFRHDDRPQVDETKRK
ncbi:MAG: hypothetical protein HGA97_02140 [Chlorobiaceae bacterium]|jgi:threonine/homoserine/homoserine lactone efflux protein|nr:hypothetical protein [Chlorobiaceae bacterium]